MSEEEISDPTKVEIEIRENDDSNESGEKKEEKKSGEDTKKISQSLPLEVKIKYISPQKAAVESLLTINLEKLIIKREKEEIIIELNSIYAVNIEKENVKIFSFDENNKKKYLKNYEFETVPNTEEERSKIVNKIQSLVFTGKIDPSFKTLTKESRKILLIANPNSREYSEKAFNKACKPILDSAHLSYKLILTEKQGHATEIASEFDPQQYNEIGIAGGDGIVHEIINGLMNHKTLHFQEVLKTPISVFPFGTDNVLANNFHAVEGIDLKREFCRAKASFACARGRMIKYDIMQAFMGNNNVVTCCEVFHFGYVSDLDIDFSTVTKLFGNDFRGPYGTTILCLKRKYYPAKLHIIQREYEDEKKKEEHYNEKLEIFSVFEKEKVDIERKKENVINYCPYSLQYFRDELKNLCPEVLQKESEDKKNESSHKTSKKILETSFFSLLISSLNYLSDELWISNKGNKNNGLVDISYVDKKMNGIKLFSLVLGKMLGKKKPKEYFDNDKIKLEKACAFCFEPTKGSYINLDGEVQPYGPLVVEVLPKLARFTHV